MRFKCDVLSSALRIAAVLTFACLAINQPLAFAASSAQDSAAAAKPKMQIRVEFAHNHDFLDFYILDDNIQLTKTGENEFFQHRSWFGPEADLAADVAKQRDKYSPLTQAIMSTNLFRSVVVDNKLEVVDNKLEYEWQKRRKISVEVQETDYRIGGEKNTSPKITAQIEAVKQAISSSLNVEVEEVLPRLVAMGEYAWEFSPRLIGGYSQAGLLPAEPPKEVKVAFTVLQAHSTAFYLNVKNRGEVVLSSREPYAFNEGDVNTYDTPPLVRMLIEEIGGGGLIRKVELSQGGMIISTWKPLRKPGEIQAFIGELQAKISTFFPCEFGWANGYDGDITGN